MSNAIKSPAPKVTLGARLMFLGLGLALLGLVVNAIISYRNLDTIAGNNRLVFHSQQVLGELEKVLSILKDAETGQRGYLLTSDEKYLEPYSVAVTKTHSALQNIKSLVADNPEQLSRFALLEPRVAAKLTELNSTIQLVKQQNPAAALEIVKSDRGKQEMDQIRELVQRMAQEEHSLLDTRSEQSDRSLRESLFTLFLASAVVLVLLLASAIGVWRYLAFRRQAEELIRGERKWLQVTLGSIGDGVIATDQQGRVAFLNQTAATLTGWSEDLARGKHLEEVFQIVNEQTRTTKVESPISKVLREGVSVALANHTVLLARDGTERPIDDSAAPIFDESGIVCGVVLVFRDAAKQRAAEEALQKLAAIVEHSEDAIISKSMDGTITSWNAAAERLLGYSPNEAIGQPISLIVPEERRRDLVIIMQKLRAGERVDHFDTIRRRKDGSQFPVSLQISPIRNSYGQVIGASKVLRDITERKRSEESLALLAKASQTLSRLMDRSSALQQAAGITVPFFADWCVVHCIDHEGNIDQQACAHREPAKERLLCDILKKHPVDWNSPGISVRVLRSGKTAYLEEVPEPVLASMVRNEEERQVLDVLHPRSIISVPLLVRDRVIGAMTFVASGSSRRYDASDVTFAEDLAGRVAAAIDNAHLFNSVRQADRQKDEFLAMLAHELRNPLAAIKYATVLAKMPTLESKGEVFEVIDRQVKNLAHLIDDLLDISRISQDKVQLKREFVDAGVMAKRAAADVVSLIEQKNHTFTIEVADEPMPLHADPTRIEQIIANLLTNAAKYTPDGGEVTLSVYPEKRSVVIRVKDSGVGIPPDMLPRVFDLFTQIDRSLDRSEGGLGIGLTVVRKLVEMHGGSVSAASQGLGHGATFTARLPLTDEKAMPLVQRHDTESAARSRLRILVVDDNRDTARASALWLAALGHEVREAFDGTSALELAREFRPNILLLDIGLPGMTGYEVAEALRRQGFEKETLIAISGYGQAEDRRRSKEAGFDHHLVKPVDHEALVSLLRNAAPGGTHEKGQ